MWVGKDIQQGREVARGKNEPWKSERAVSKKPQTKHESQHRCEDVTEQFSLRNVKASSGRGNRSALSHRLFSACFTSPVTYGENSLIFLELLSWCFFHCTLSFEIYSVVGFFIWKDMCVCFLWEMLSFYKFLIAFFLHLIFPTACFIRYWVLVSFFLSYFGLISFLPVFFFFLLVILLLKFFKDLHNRLTTLKYFLCLETIKFLYRGCFHLSKVHWHCGLGLSIISSAILTVKC